MKQDRPATRSPNMVDCLDQIGMRPSQRRMARASLRQAELIVDMLIRANNDFCCVLGFVGRGIDALSRRNKVSQAAPKLRTPS